MYLKPEKNECYLFKFMIPHFPFIQCLFFNPIKIILISKIYMFINLTQA